jgi:hypothetical protein
MATSATSEPKRLEGNQKAAHVAAFLLFGADVKLAGAKQTGGPLAAFSLMKNLGVCVIPAKRSAEPGPESHGLNISMSYIWKAWALRSRISASLRPG